MNKALFLDRDGVINIEKNYVYRIEDFEFIEGIFELCKAYQDKGYLIFVITNQAGIARNYYNTGDFEKLTQWMIAEFDKQGITISKVFFCPHHPNFTGACKCRKPQPGMILDAQAEFKLNLAQSVLIGDKNSDIEAGVQAGVGSNILFTNYRHTNFATN
jgi:D-glycero-D-manno-heptose 1,7-bisphosphate phosphatase